MMSSLCNDMFFLFAGGYISYSFFFRWDLPVLCLIFSRMVLGCVGFGICFFLSFVTV